MQISIAKQHIKKIFDEALEKVRKGEKPNIFGLMKKYGYSYYSAKAQKVTKTKTWAQLLKEIDDEPLLKKLNQIALDKKDKRANIEAIKEIFKLKDRYPKQKLAVELFEEELKKIKEEE